MSRWVEQQVGSITGLRGRTIQGWAATEMAFREEGPDGLPQWEDESAPVLQLSRIDLDLAGGETARIVTYQGFGQWGLCHDDGLPPLSPGVREPTSNFRDRELPELPTGVVHEVQVVVDGEGDIAEVRMAVGGHEVWMRAGEFYESPGSLVLHEMDESILVQVDGRRPTRFRASGRV